MPRSQRPPVKLSPPRLRRVVRRERLCRILEAAQGQAVWVAAPAGYGKTTLAARYVADESRASIWYRTDAGDVDPAGLFHYLARAVRTGSAAALPHFGSEYGDRLEAFARRFFCAFYARLPDSAIVVLDDLHAAGEPLLSQVLGPAIVELPPTIRLILLSRALPPLNLVAAEAHEQLEVIDGSMLAFTQDETRSVAELRLPAALVQANADRLHQVTKGWPAALVLVCATLARDSAAVETIVEYSREAAFGLLTREVFDALPEDERVFMLLTAPLDQVTPASAAAMTGRADAKALLESFVSRGMFVNRIAAAGPAYRYHELLRDFLRSPAMALPADAMRSAVVAGIRSLAASGEWDDAIALALRHGRGDLAAPMLERHAPTLVAQGRRATLQGAARRLSEPWPAPFPELAYWIGVTHMIGDEQEACRWFERAYVEFTRAGDRGRAQLAAAQAVLAIHMSWHTYVIKDTWLARLAQFGPDAATALSSAERIRIATARLRAAEMDDAGAFDASDTAQRADELLGLLAGPTGAVHVDDRFIAADALQEHASIAGRREIFERAAAAVIADLHHPDLSPWAKLHWLISFGTVAARRFPCHPRGTPYATAEDALAEAQKLANREGLQSLEFSATFARCAVALARGDERVLRAQVGYLDRITDARYPMQVSSLMPWKATVALADGNPPAALECCAAAVEAGLRGGLPRGQMWSIRLTEAQAMMAAGRNVDAALLMDAEAGFHTGHFRRLCELVAGTARLRGQREMPDEYARNLSSLVCAIRESGWVNYLSSVPDIAAEIWADALAQSIQVEFVSAAIRARRLKPPRPPIEEWPWTLRVRVLGSFEVAIHGEPLRSEGKVQRKPLELLRFVATHHPVAVPMDGAMKALWPDADRRAAKAALDVAVHRLRKLLEESDLLVVADGALSLDPCRAWVDAGAIEQWADEAVRRLDRHAGAAAAALATRLVMSYRGPLLGAERGPAWAVARREMLHSRFVDLAAGLGRFHERAGDFDAARTVYEHAVAVEPLAEGFYRGLMRCHGAAGETAEVMRSFRRCREVLSIILGIAPASETLSLLVRLCEIAA